MSLNPEYHIPVFRHNYPEAYLYVKIGRLLNTNKACLPLTACPNRTSKAEKD